MKTFTDRLIGDIMQDKTFPHRIHPRLIEAIGTYEAMVVTYFHDWTCVINKNPGQFKVNFREGKAWVYRTVKQISNDLGIAYGTLRKILTKMRETGTLFVSKFNSFKTNKKLWYSLNYEKEIRMEVEEGEIEENHAQFEQDSVPGEHNKCSSRAQQVSQGSTSRSFSISSLKSPKDDADKSASSGIPTNRSTVNTKKPVNTSPPSSAPPPSPQDRKKQYAERMVKKLMERLSKKPSVPAAIEFWKAMCVLNDVKSVSLSKQEAGNMKTLIKWLDDMSVRVDTFLSYALDNWAELRKEIVWSDSKKSRLGKYPFFKEVFYNREDILTHLLSGDVKTIAERDEADEWVTVTQLENLPTELYNYDSLATQIKVLGVAKVPREEYERYS